MWPVDDQMPTFKALSYWDKLRVGRRVTKGEAPDDPLMASAAVELAESYKHGGRVPVISSRWGPAIMIVLFGCLFVLDVIDRDQLGQILNALIILLFIPHLFFNPGTRPKNMARSLEASSRIAAAAS